MKNRNVLAVIILGISVFLFFCSTVSVDTKIFGQEFKWDGLNLTTISNDKYKGEVQFKSGREIRGGTEYVFEVFYPLTGASETDSQVALDMKISYAENVAESFAARLEQYGYRDFELRTAVKKSDDTITLNLVFGNLSEFDMQIIPLLGSKGQIEFWTQDPDFDVETQDLESFSYLQGMAPSTLTLNDIASFESINSSKANGHGFKVVFKEESSAKFVAMSQIETSRGTMMVIDGQPVGFRVYPVENLSADGSTKPVLYLSSLFTDTFDVNDAVIAVYQAGEMEQSLTPIDSSEVTGIYDDNFEWDFKFFSLMGLLLMGIIFIFRYRLIGILFPGIIALNLIYTLFLLKLFGESLTISLIFGVFVGIIFVLLMFIDIVRGLKKYSTGTNVSTVLKQMDADLEPIRTSYRNLGILFLGIIALLSYLPFVEVAGLMSGFGASILSSLLILYIVTKVFLPQVYIWHLKRK